MATQNLPAHPPTPAMPEPVVAQVKIPVTDLSKVWILHYRHGMNPNCQKCFYHDGDMRSAVEVTKRHCEIMGYRWIFVRPFVVDLKQEEIDKVTYGQ